MNFSPVAVCVCDTLYPKVCANQNQKSKINQSICSKSYVTGCKPRATSINSSPGLRGSDESGDGEDVGRNTNFMFMFMFNFKHWRDVLSDFSFNFGFMYAIC